MKNLINEINQEMLANGEGWQITSIKAEETVSMPVSKFAEMVEYIVCNEELQNLIYDEYMDIEREQAISDESCRLEGNGSEFCFEVCPAMKRAELYMNIYNEFKRENKEEDDEDIPF